MSTTEGWTFPAGSRYFECVIPALNVEKFWCYRLLPGVGSAEIRVEVHWGRIATAGQRQEKPFGSRREAESFVEEKTTEKLRKGYESRDEAWVRRMWTDWRPPIAVDFTQGAGRPVARQTCRHEWVDFTRFGDAASTQRCARCGADWARVSKKAEEPVRPRFIQPGPQPPLSVRPAPRPAPEPKPRRRVIDFTEDS